MAVMAAVAAVAVVDHRHPLLALAQTPAQGETATKEIPDQGPHNPSWLYIEVSDYLPRPCTSSSNGAVEHLNINVGPVDERGYIKTVPTARMPRRLLLTANCYVSGADEKFAFLVDVLLVPLSFNVQTCFDLYLEPFNPQSTRWYMGTRRIRDNIILLRRLGIQGESLVCAAEQCDIPEDIRNRSDYRLVVTIPVAHDTPGWTERGLFIHLEMEV